ncbi:MAG: cytochrome c oxidase subunit 3 [Archangium sp.]|nr:cytochrome c oxidase subunit 3 [Archangium sp.]MDP3152742.1 cytochrome c oxidase subunit 3 [Archangium sp.]MDP3573529.1 cytochrome c oxidase subunit 3 [Archangium sp.]
MSSFPRPIATTRSVTGISTGKLAVWWLIASEIVIFGGVLGSYLMHRIGHPEWASQAAHTNTVFGAVNTFVLLTSSLFAVMAHQAADQKDGKKAAKFLYLTTLGAVIFLIIKSVEWTGEIQHGFTITSHTFWSFYYTAAGIHGVHVIVGAIIMLVIANDARKGIDLQRVEAVGLYWHFVDIVWIFLFPLLYIAK